MNTFKYMLIAIAALCMAGCSSDDDDFGGNNGGAKGNTNANSTASCKYADRLEFPKLKGGNNMVLVNTTGDRYDQDGVNYCVEWDLARKSQRWSCYQMHTGFSKNGVSRFYATGNERQYPWDPRLTNGTTYLDDDYFKNSGFDHGHICPSADRLYSTTANIQTFYMTNMQPQYNVFNTGIWSKLESQIRTWTNATGTEVLYVCKGGTIDKTEDCLTPIKGKLLVPKYFYTALLLKNSMGYKAIAFWFENEKVDHKSDKLSKYAMSVNDLEKRTGIDFFCNLPDDIEEDREKRCDLNSWGLQ